MRYLINNFDSLEDTNYMYILDYLKENFIFKMEKNMKF